MVIDSIRAWIKELPETTGFTPMLGEWYAYSDSYNGEYIAISQVGGRRLADDVRYPHYSITCVSKKLNNDALLIENQLRIMRLMDSILAKTIDLPDLCKMLKVNPVGEVVGPTRTSGRRVAATITLEVISQITR